MSTRESVALPPDELIARVGDDPGDTVGQYDAIGTRQRRLLESYLPPGWVWTDKTYLDWGAGAGRLVRHFLSEAESNRVIGADIHEPSVSWIEENLAPVEGLLVHEEPVIALDDNSVDLVSGFSVMTHITDHWAGWLLEIRRVLRPGGVALLSFCGQFMLPRLLRARHADRRRGDVGGQIREPVVVRWPDRSALTLVDTRALGARLHDRPHRSGCPAGR